uniref:DDE Tnp4 domain-containing protein n=1 Tax=Cyprinus carpio TaxID=7962 RepID=A0A8C2JXU0_CYPCA
MVRRELLAAAILAGKLYLEAEEKAANLRCIGGQRRNRMRRRLARRRYLLATVILNSEKANIQNYTLLNSQVPILRVYFSEADTVPSLRLSRTTIDMLTQVLPRKKDHGWSHEIEVLVLLYWLACGASYRVTADAFAMPTSTVCRVVHNVIENMLKVLHRIIHFPGPQEMEEVGEGFACLAGHNSFKKVAGAIDGCHIRIRPPAGQQKQCYINRKLFPSIILQAITDSTGKFLDIYVGNPGSVHDALVLRRCPMYKQSFFPPKGFFLLGDGGYPCLQHPVAIITPYRQPLAGHVECRFNKHHAKARCIIERTFGMLKTRWRAIFLRALEIHPLFAPKVVAVCCMLHNLCQATNDILEEEHTEDVDEDTENTDEDLEQNGNNRRARLAAQLSAPEELPACLQEHDYS